MTGDCRLHTERQSPVFMPVKTKFLFPVQEALSFPYSDGGPSGHSVDRKIYETDEFLRVFISHFTQKMYVAFPGMLIDSVDVVVPGGSQTDKDLPAVFGGSAALDQFLSVQTAQNVRNAAGCDSQM